MKDEYFHYYLLSYFNLEKVTSLSQILHVFNAKRTPSMFYMIEKNNWHHGFSFNHYLERDDLEKITDSLVEKKYIQKEEKGYRLTDLGLQQRGAYFEKHYFPKQIKTFTNANTRTPFWNRLQLYSQVFSEFSYNNTKYAPIIKHPYHQENVRQLFHQFHLEREKVLERWIREQTYLFEHLEDATANILASQLTGHGVIGKTKAQMAEELQMKPLEFYFYFQDGLEALIQLIRAHENKLTLMATILNQIHQEENFGLSSSTNQTLQLFKEGYTLEQVASQRAIKVNTVREHILEIAFVFTHFPYAKVVPKSVYSYLTQRFDEKENYHYRQAKEENETLQFMDFRLVELERMRTK